MFSAATKNYLKSTIRQTDTHNRMLEVEEMWRTREAHKLVEGKSKPWKTRAAYMDQSEETRPDNSEEISKTSSKKSTYWMRELQKAEEDHGDRWGHAGYKEMHPEDFVSSYSSSDGDSATADFKKRKKRKSRGKDRKKKKKEKKKKSSKKSKKNKQAASNSESSVSFREPKNISNSCDTNLTNNEITYGPHPPVTEKDPAEQCGDLKTGKNNQSRKHRKRPGTSDSRTDSDNDDNRQVYKLFNMNVKKPQKAAKIERNA